MSHDEEKLMSGEAWREFCDRLKGAGETILGKEFPQDPRGRAEGYRALTRLLSFATLMEIESSDPLYPVLYRYEEPHNQWGGPNPDNTYVRAAIDPEHSYRVWGNLSNMRQAIMSLHEGDMQLEEYGVYSEQSLADWELGPNGEFELWISKQRLPGNWMPMHEKARIFTTRIYQSDWIHDSSPALHIERVGAEGVAPPPIDPAALAVRLQRAVNWVEKSVNYWNQLTERGWDKAEKNKVYPATSMPGGAKNMIYGLCHWDLQGDEAIVMLCDEPDAPYWGFCTHTMSWLESGDMPNRQVSLSSRQMHIDEDGRFRVVVSARDPGVPNWIDTEGRRRGALAYRWVWARNNPTPEGQHVKIDEVRSLMPQGHPVIDGAERRKRLSARREQYWSRYI